MRRECIHRPAGPIIRARVWRVSKYKSQPASKELPDYCPCCVDWNRYPRNTPGVLPDDKRTLFVPVPLLHRNNEAIYTNVPGVVPRWKLRQRLTGVFVPKMQIATPIAAVVPTRLELINSPVLVLHFVQSPPLIRVNCASYAINTLIATSLRAIVTFDDCCDLTIELQTNSFWRIITRM